MPLYLGNTIISNKINAGDTLTPNTFDLFDVKWTDHLILNISWMRADTFDWINGDIYKDAATELYNEFIEATKDSTPPEIDEIDGISIPYWRTAKGYKIVNYGGEAPEEREALLQQLYDKTGIAWYYLIDTTGKTRFKLPRTKYGFSGIRSGAGNFIPESLPNITGDTVVKILSNAPEGGSASHTNNVSGAFAVSKQVCYLNGGEANTMNAYEGTFNASRCSNSYRDNANVQEKSTEGYLYFYLTDSVRLPLNINLEDFISDTNTSIQQINTQLINLENKINTDITASENKINANINTLENKTNTELNKCVKLTSNNTLTGINTFSGFNKFDIGRGQGIDFYNSESDEVFRLRATGSPYGGLALIYNNDTVNPFFNCDMKNARIILGNTNIKAQTSNTPATSDNSDNIPNTRWVKQTCPALTTTNTFTGINRYKATFAISDTTDNLRANYYTDKNDINIAAIEAGTASNYNYFRINVRNKDNSAWCNRSFEVRNYGTFSACVGPTISSISDNSDNLATTAWCNKGSSKSPAKTTLFKPASPYGTGDITLSQAYTNFDEIVIFAGADNGSGVTSFTIPTWELIERINLAKSRNTTFALFYSNIYWFCNSSTSTTTLLVEGGENCSIYAIYGLNYRFPRFKV